ncbi:hypothetical protein SpAn4DRAFT_2784 [Sporomusa ovata]|uniref:Uncharacterized protein n=1 Tax=Sporomusa ovata TaxID=2378 RepID=A0A0U1L073_9FIRM|nr:hypothetical protein SpAn4DRAFT_2784 [Sporomusa ovata]
MPSTSLKPGKGKKIPSLVLGWAKESELNLTSKLYIFIDVISIMLNFFKLYLLVRFILFLALAILALAVARAFFDTTTY